METADGFVDGARVGAVGVLEGVAPAAPAVVGKSAERVKPVTYTLPDASTAMAAAKSKFEPPM